MMPSTWSIIALNTLTAAVERQLRIQLKYKYKIASVV
jgi:hypothetical protein